MRDTTQPGRQKRRGPCNEGSDDTPRPGRRRACNTTGHRPHRSGDAFPSSRTRRLVELPEPRLPRQDARWGECLRLLEAATQIYRSGAYEQAMVNCRQVVEGIPQVLADAWHLPQKRANQSQDGWLQELENRLSAAWPMDTITPGMLRTLLSGGWQWLAPAPHYNTGMPQREAVAFALGLSTDLLLFAAQLLQAHHQPIVATAP